jgi:CRISPR-associated endonuclease/helicase Cas3
VFVQAQCDTAPLAHSSHNEPGHRLDDHLRSVSALAANFAAGYGSDWAGLAGLWHDLGKYRSGFQRHIRQTANEEAHIEGKVAGREKTHSAAGALWAIQSLTKAHGEPGKLAARVLAYLIASHHAGLYDWNGTEVSPSLDARLTSEDSQVELTEALNANPAANILSAGEFTPDLRNIPGGSAGFSLWVRMLFSALVDADFLDTEAYFDTGKPEARKGFPAIEALLPALNEHITGVSEKATPSTVNTLRADILRQCRDKAALPPGFFSLTVPTGGGKTLASLAFALEHINAHKALKLRRVIYAIPYTSIIEQTANVFREAFKSLGDEVLIEHHSQADANEHDETARSRLSCENWDAPLIVTTNVQLFESLFAAKTSRCRKLHHLVNSVIVLDEAQQLPPEFLQPILDVLNLLVKHYGVTVVLCTATQPALSSTNYFDASQNLRGLENVREIIDDPDSLYAQLKRVNVELQNDWQTPMEWPAVAAALSAEDCVLAIVNTRKAARELFKLLPAGTLHLSALMCGEHRSAVIKQIKARLEAKREGRDQEPLRVVSTQLVEAGVDLDFPVVWRALAGLDSIAQAAGRCNREGKIAEGGRVVVFVPPGRLPAGSLQKGADACISILHDQNVDPLSRQLFGRYFQDFYRATNLDKRGICGLVRSNASDESKLISAVYSGQLPSHLVGRVTEQIAAAVNIQFRSAANAFRLIDDEDSATVIVRYHAREEDIEMLLNTISKEGPKRWSMRKLQRYSVTIHKRDADKLLGRGLRLLPAVPGLYVQEADGMYDNRIGFRGDDFDADGSAVIF